ncbi:MAG: ABC transporter ATP-binding protein [Myxococcota bacterium]
MTPLLSLSKVDAGYGAADVVRGVSLDVRPGEAWAVLGPNGAGKSTLVRVVMGLLPARAGTVEVTGLRLPAASPAELSRRVAWVPQVMDDDAGFTALELALMGRAPHLGAWGLPGAKDEERALACLEELGVAALAERPLSEVSGGERRRVWLARALVQAPQLLVLDEPTAFLDVRHQVELLRAVRRRVAWGLGVLAVLHDVNLAAHFATHALLLKDGRVLAQGPVGEVLTTERLSELYGIAMHAARDDERVHVPRWS